MVIEWKEQEQSEEDELSMGNERCMEALRDFGLKKFFLTPCLHAQPEMLQYLISIWDEDQESSSFEIRNLRLMFLTSNLSQDCCGGEQHQS